MQKIILILIKERMMIVDNNYTILPSSPTEEFCPPAIKQPLEEISIEQMEVKAKQIYALHLMCKKTFSQNEDFGVIPGCKKPSLFKPGAEKVVNYLRCRPKYILEEEERDFTEPFFSFEYKCILIDMYGNEAGEGIGACNSKENKYKNNPDKYMLLNTCKKMAKKRSYVDAALTIGCLSGMYTQDMEDIDLSGNTVSDKIKKSQEQTKKDTRIITEGQSKRMFAIAKGDRAKIDEIIKKYNYTSSKDVQRCDYENICSEIDGVKLTPATATEDEGWPTDEDYAGAFTNSKEESPF